MTRWTLSLWVLIEILIVSPTLAATPTSPEIFFAVGFTENGLVESRDKNGLLRGTAQIVRVQGQCKWFRTDGTRDEWKVCREGRYWRFIDPRGTSVRVDIDDLGSSGSCVRFKFRTLTSPEFKGSYRGCRDGAKWVIRD